jgi:hypothetical protein
MVGGREMWWVLASGGQLDGVVNSMGDYVTDNCTKCSKDPEQDGEFGWSRYDQDMDTARWCWGYDRFVHGERWELVSDPFKVTKKCSMKLRAQKTEMRCCYEHGILNYLYAHAYMSVSPMRICLL